MGAEAGSSAVAESELFRVDLGPLLRIAAMAASCDFHRIPLAMLN